MKTNQKVWKGLEELNNTPEFEKQKHNEFPEKLPAVEEASNDLESMKAPRRDFLKMLGFSLTAATVASCQMPVKKVIPYLEKPGNVTPGVPNFYATTYAQAGEYASILVKNREGRPIKIEGNQLSSITKGTTSARMQAIILNLYDSTRLQTPMIKGNPSNNHALDEQVIKSLNQLSDSKIAVVTPSLISPSTKKVVENFTSKYPNISHVQYDSISNSGMIEANISCFDIPALPSYDFAKAEVIVSLGADFLGDWYNSVELSHGYTTGRKLTKDNPKMSRHYQFEGFFTMTGTNADYRSVIKPSEEGAYAVALYNEVANILGVTNINGPEITGDLINIKKAARDLVSAKGKSLVVAGSNDKNIQIIINGINYLLGNYGSTIDINNPVFYRQATDSEFVDLIDDMNSGDIDGVIFYGVNPVYNHPMADAVKSGIEKLQFSAAISERMDETAELVQFVSADRFFLESWNDAMPRNNYYSLCQPTIQPLFPESRQGQDTLLAWSGETETYYDVMTSNWKSNILKGESWDTALHDGVFEKPSNKIISTEFGGDVMTAASKISPPSSGLELALYYKNTIGDGSYANNPFMQECPDSVTKVTWDNYLMVSPKMAEDNDWSQEDVVVVEANGKKVNLPVLVQPGVKKDVVAIALGYGREDKTSKAGKIGQNVAPFMNNKKGTFDFVVEGVKITNTGKTYPIAQTQVHHHINPKNRPIIREATLDQYKESPYAGYHRFNDKGDIIVDGEKEFKRIKATKDQNLYPEIPKPGHHWGMSIDLNSCIGCNACVISCNVENNIPVVGKNEVKRRHDMHWLRIDRYYISSDDHHYSDGNENPRVVHQPMMCQHCDNAPCENVCPVNATNHSDEGLNQMVYNRCVGTRYCENNCPYKVRRFNWYDYTGQDSFAWNEQIHPTMSNEKGDQYDDLVKMVLNPDVTVRSRGVIEKCSMCVQQIQAAKLEAKKKGERLGDNVLSACQSGCPTDCITFGDVKNPESNVSKAWADERNFYVLEETHVLPNVGYLTKIRNIDNEEL
jgi:molybdopterin-containing oxidoreductase family iron-sulfur binding subunit